MLRHLHIENIAVVKCADIDMSEGFSVLTGETGAGKSVIIDSVKLLTGRKVTRDLIRTGEEYAFCEALFDGIDGDDEEYFRTLGVVPDDGEVIVSVKLSGDGKTLSKINGKTVTKTVLRDVSSRLISIHGQNDSNILWDEGKYVSLLDSFSPSGELLEEYKVAYAELRELKRRLNSLMSDDALLERERDMLIFQIKDIDSGKLKVGEEESLSSELKRLENSEKINKNVKLAYKVLKGAENGGVTSLLSKASSAMSQLSGVLPEAGDISERLSEMSYDAEDIAERVYALSDGYDDDPTEKLDRIQARLEKINKLKKRYGNSIEKILAFREDASARLDEIQLSDEKCAEYELKIKEVSARAKDIADKLTKIRKKSAKEASAGIQEVLIYLDMPSVSFNISVEDAGQLTSTGCDEVKFLVATNAGEPQKPMSEIASGGELSRIMLALKCVINEKDSIGCAVYDEVDTGISGKTSRKIGLKLSEISSSGQVICVTHSAQIATLADTHLLISKSERDGRAYTSVRRLSADERVDECARILGGINVTDAQRQAAKDMLSEKNNC